MGLFCYNSCVLGEFGFALDLFQKLKNGVCFRELVMFKRF